MMIRPVNEDDLRRSAFERLGRGQPTKAAADNYDDRFIHTHTGEEAGEAVLVGNRDGRT